MIPSLHHPLSVPDLVEAILLDRLSPSAAPDGDRPCVRFLASRERALAEAQPLQEAREPPGIAPPGEGDWTGAVLVLGRAAVSTATALVAAPGGDGEGEWRSRSDIRGIAARVEAILLADEEIDRHAAALAAGHPQDDGTGRLTRAALALLDDLYADPRRIAPDLPPALPRPR